MTDKETAAESLLKLISCGCKTNCRKVSLSAHADDMVLNVVPYAVVVMD